MNFFLTNLPQFIKLRAQLSFIEGMSFSATADSGHRVVLDGPPELGGRNKGIRPMEMILIGLGGCSAFDVLHILRKAHLQIKDCQIELKAERAAQVPKVFTKIHLHFVVSGRNIPPAKVSRAIELSAEKYCSASIMLGKTAAITHDFEIIET